MPETFFGRRDAAFNSRAIRFGLNRHARKLILHDGLARFLLNRVGATATVSGFGGTAGPQTSRRARLRTCRPIRRTPSAGNFAHGQSEDIAFGPGPRL